jgi:hypothetical protein
MNIQRIRAARERATPRADGHPQASPLASIAHGSPQLPAAISRRSFVRTTAGVVAGAALGSGIIRPSAAHAFATSDPVPIPGGTPLLGGGFHVYAPGGDPIDSDPITITDFNGFVGLAYISGMVTRRHRITGVVEVLPFLGADMRFMQGIYRANDGRVQRGTFGLI